VKVNDNVLPEFKYTSSYTGPSTTTLNPAFQAALLKQRLLFQKALLEKNIKTQHPSTTASEVNLVDDSSKAKRTYITTKSPEVTLESANHKRLLSALREFLVKPNTQLKLDDTSDTVEFDIGLKL